MHMIDLIHKKRTGGKLSQEEIDFFVQGVTDGSIPDYQIASFLMAVCFTSMDADETANLTLSMVASGKTYDLSDIPGFKVDKHSTGGVADTTTLILAPLVASLSIPVIKMSGRGLGFSGGTLDKLSAIPGFQVEVTKDDAISYGQKSNIVIMSQSAELTPADKKLYALRDVTGTVDSLPLIAASIMSKKIAAGADGIVLDVKCGNGAFMKTEEDAYALGRTMMEIGNRVGKKVTVMISSMAQPLGQNIGNSLEVIEAIEVLKGNIAGDLLEVSLLLGANMLLLANRVKTQAEGKLLLLEQIKNGKGLQKLRELIVQQGGNPDILEDTSLLPLSPIRMEVKAMENGYLTELDTELIGRASVLSGAGRMEKDDIIDYGAGLILKKRLGDYVNKDDVLLEIYAETEAKATGAKSMVSRAFTIEETQKPLPQLVLDIIREGGKS